LGQTGVPRACNPNHIDVKIIGDGFGFLLWLERRNMVDTYVRLATIIVKNMEESVEFYSDVMGFKINSEYDLGSTGRITLMQGNGDAMVELIESSSYPVGFWSVGISVDDMEAAMAKYKKGGAKSLENQSQLPEEAAPLFRVQMGSG